MTESPLVQRELVIGDSLTKQARPRTFSGRQRADRCNGRFLDRSAPNGQSDGMLNIERSNKPGGSGLYYKDWVHTLLHRKSHQLALLLFFVEIVAFLFFTPFWWLLSDRCGLDFANKGQAFIFTVYTFTTVGYGVKSDYMDGCIDGAMLLTIQQVFAMILNAVILGGFWLRISRPDARASTIIFSKKAVVQEIRGKLYFMCQVAELRKHQLVEAHVRCYALRTKPTFCASTMRMQHPDDATNNQVLLCFPVVVVHRIDNWSPLSPPTVTSPLSSSWSNPAAVGGGGGDMGGGDTALAEFVKNGNNTHDPSTHYLFPDVLQREADVESGEREVKPSSSEGAPPPPPLPVLPPPSPSSYLEGTAAATAAAIPAPPPPSSLPSLSSSSSSSSSTPNATGASSSSSSSSELQRKKEAVQDWLRQSSTEVLVLIEGEENITGCSLQARHSYTIDDMAFDMTFAPCVTAKEGGGCVIDFEQFQELVGANENRFAGVADYSHA